MAFPDTDLTQQWTDIPPEYLNATKMNQRIDQNLNLLAQRLRAIGGSQLMAQQTTGQTGWINSGAFVACTSMTASLDPAAAFASNAWTVPTTGIYDISAQASLTAGGTSRLRTAVGIGINGSLTPMITAVAAANTAAGCAQLAECGVSLTAGQTVSLLLFHDASTSIGSSVTSSTFSYLRIRRVS